MHFTVKAYSEFFNVWFGGTWECQECGEGCWAVDASAAYHTCTNCGYVESLGAIPALAAAQDKRGKVDFAAVMSVYDDGAAYQHPRSTRWHIQLGLINAGVLYGRVPVPPGAYHFHNSDAARAYIEEQLYSKGMRCPECGKRKGRECLYQGRYQCCGKKFSIYKDTPLANTRVGAHLWLRALWALKNGTDPKETDWLAYIMQAEWGANGEIITNNLDPYYGQTVRSVMDRLNADEQFTDVVGAKFDMQSVNPAFVRALLAHRKGDPYEAVKVEGRLTRS